MNGQLFRKLKLAGIRWSSHLAQAALQEAAFAVVGDQGQGALIIFGCFVEQAQAAVQIGARGCETSA